MGGLLLLKLQVTRTPQHAIRITHSKTHCKDQRFKIQEKPKSKVFMDPGAVSKSS
ncbi:hypothetical protein BH23THE1_BH23THE1_13540 [soil metagenome]